LVFKAKVSFKVWHSKSFLEILLVLHQLGVCVYIW